MSEASRFFTEYGYLVLFGWVLAEQLGLPIPSIPVLLAAGALAGAGRAGLMSVILVSTAASLLADFMWYEVGRRKGAGVLRFLCRVSLEPDSCVRRTESAYHRYGAGSLLVAKFIPGFATVAPPLAGTFGLGALRFLAFAAAGSLVYAGTFILIGYLFSEQVQTLAAHFLQMGEGLAVVLVGALGGYILVKLWRRRRFLHNLRTARITPEELKERLDAGEDMLIVDLRHLLDVETDPHHIPGALHLSPDDLDVRHHEIPRDRDIVLYCT